MKAYDFFRRIKIDRYAAYWQKRTVSFSIRCKRGFYCSKLTKIECKPDISLNILVVANLGGIGNAIAATPLVQALRMLYPTAYIVFLAKQGDLFDSWCVPDIIIKDKESIPPITFDKVFVSYWGYPIHPKWVDDIPAKKMYKPSVWFNSWFLKPERDYNVDMARKLGYKGLIPPEYVSIKQSLISDKYNNSIVILPCSNSSPKWEGKRWQYYGELIKKLTQEFPNTKIIVLGTSDDKVDGIEFSDQVIDLRGRLTLAEVAGVLRVSKLVVGNDCGPAHIADCVGANTFVIFGSSCPVKNRYIRSQSMLPKGIFFPSQYSSHLNNITAVCLEDVLKTILK